MSSGQTYPRDYFQPPLDTPLIITGTFGEVRVNHLHSGIDISTNGNEGIPVMAAADGYISRIKIASDGYGKALYVTHPNGFVTVYGHLQKFTAPVNAYIRKIQYERQVFEVDEKFGPEEFKVKQHEVIAYSGGTGAAQEPHLHFEVRDEITEEPINPLLFGIPVHDTVAPVLKYVRIYPARENGILNRADSADSYEIRKDENGYSLNTTEFPVVYGSVAFGIAAYDYQYQLLKPEEADSVDDVPVNPEADTNNVEEPDQISSPSVLGIYSCELFIDDVPTFTWRYDRFNFNDTRDVNGHIDYRVRKRNDDVVERCFRLPNDKLKIYGDDNLKGYTEFKNDGSHTIKIIVRDFKGNKSQIEFTVNSISTLSQTQYLPRPENTLPVSADKAIAVHTSKLDVMVPDGGLFEDMFYSDYELDGGNFISGYFSVGDPFEALHLPMTLGLKPNKDLNDSLKKKAIILRYDEDNTFQSYTGTWTGKMLNIKSFDFGKYGMVIDSIAPTIEKYYVPAEMNSMYGGIVQYKIKDELSGIKSYSGMIDGKWYLFEYDKKNDMITANVDPLAVNKEHSVEITVTDQCGNVEVYKGSFYF